MDNTRVVEEARDAISKKSEEAEGFLNDGINKLRAKMAPSGKSYTPPSIPETPSRAINDMLNDKCGKTQTSPVKHYLSVFVCLVFSAIAKVYKLIYKDTTKPSHTMWMAACGVVCLEHILACWVIYYVIIACSFLLHHLLYYAVIIFCLFGAGLTVAGMMFFDKAKAQSPGFEPTSKNE